VENGILNLAPGCNLCLGVKHFQITKFLIREETVSKQFLLTAEFKVKKGDPRRRTGWRNLFAGANRPASPSSQAE
jgi:hypothetical protein